MKISMMYYNKEINNSMLLFFVFSLLIYNITPLYKAHRNTNKLFVLYNKMQETTYFIDLVISILILFIPIPTSYFKKKKGANTKKILPTML